MPRMPSPWSARHEEAAQLVARDRLTNQQIADRIGITPRALTKWKARPEFTARVAAIVEETRRALLSKGIADTFARISALDEQWRRILRLIEARSREMADVPGGDTGLLVRRVRMVKVYPGAETDYKDSTDLAPHEEVAALAGDRVVGITEYTFDAALLRALRDCSRHASIEVGHWQRAGLTVDRPTQEAAYLEYLARMGEEVAREWAEEDQSSGRDVSPALQGRGRQPGQGAQEDARLDGFVPWSPPEDRS